MSTSRSLWLKDNMEWVKCSKKLLETIVIEWNCCPLKPQYLCYVFTFFCPSKPLHKFVHVSAHTLLYGIRISFPFCNSISFGFVVVHNNVTMGDHRVLSYINVQSVFYCPLIYLLQFYSSAPCPCQMNANYSWFMYQLMTDFLFSVAEYSVADMTINNWNLIDYFWHSREIFAQCL